MLNYTSQHASVLSRFASGGLRAPPCGTHLRDGQLQLDHVLRLGDGGLEGGVEQQDAVQVLPAAHGVVVHEQHLVHRREVLAPDAAARLGWKTRPIVSLRSLTRSETGGSLGETQLTEVTQLQPGSRHIQSSLSFHRTSFRRSPFYSQ